MSRSLFSRAFLPPRDEAPLEAERVQAFARIRLTFGPLALLADLIFWLALKDSPAVHHDVLVRFLFINIPLICLDVLLAWGAVGRPRVARATWLPSLCIEMFTTFVFIQASGSVSSYFLFFVPVIIVSYRLLLGYRPGVTALALAMGLHLGCWLLETFGLLRQASLFVGGAGIYGLAGFRLGALSSIQMVLAISFAFPNGIMRLLREKDDALDAAHRDLERAVERAQPGRLSGKTIGGKYALAELLGRGGMGEVYQARRTADGVSVAVKVLYPHLGELQEIVERFKREADVAARLAGARVAPVRDFGTADDGCPFLVMDLLKGEDLAALLRRRGKLNSSELLPIVDQLAEVLTATHAAGIVHRDLKPQNVFLTDTADGRPDVRLLDFGIARLLVASSQQLTQTSAMVGTPGYLAPEQVAETLGEVGPHTDVFALGAVIYRALTGVSAFPSRNPVSAAYEALYLVPQMPSLLDRALPADLDVVLALALAKQPRLRYATAAELARDLRAAVEGTLTDAVRERAAALPVTVGDVARVA